MKQIACVVKELITLTIGKRDTPHDRTKTHDKASLHRPIRSGADKASPFPKQGMIETTAVYPLSLSLSVSLSFQLLVSGVSLQ